MADTHHDHGHHDHEHGHDHDLLPTQALTIFGLVLSVICILGIIGNVLSTIVLIKGDMRNSIKYILLGLTFFDSLLLASYLATFILYAFDPYNGVHSHENIGWFYFLHTQIIYPICQTAYTGSVYFIILVTAERYIAVCWPLLVNRFLTAKVALYSLIGMITFSILLNLPRWLELLTIGSVQLHHNANYIRYYHGLVWISFMYVLPFLVLGILNFLIWRQVKEANVIRTNMSPLRAEISVTKMLLTVVGVFIACNAINCLLLIIFVIRGGEHHAYIIGMVIAVPLIINSSVNIIIYCVKGKAFRTQFVKMVKPWACCLCSCCRGRFGGEVPLHKMASASSSSASSNVTGEHQITLNSAPSVKHAPPSPFILYRLKSVQDKAEENSGSIQITNSKNDSEKKIMDKSTQTPGQY